MKKALALLSLTVCAVSHNAFAGTGAAGCGLGSVVIHKNSVLSQVFAATTNGTTSNQTFGITSGTSNCQASGLVKADKEQIFYAEANYENLIVEMARGSGENLTAFAQTLGCNERSLSNFGDMTRARYQEIIPNQKTTPLEMLEALKKRMKADPKLSQECKLIG